MNFNPEDYHPERDSDWGWQSCPECGKTETLAADEANLQDVYVRVYAQCCDISWIYCWEDDHQFAEVWTERGPDQEPEDSPPYIHKFSTTFYTQSPHRDAHDALEADPDQVVQDLMIRVLELKRECGLRTGELEQSFMPWLTVDADGQDVAIQY